MKQILQSLKTGSTEVIDVPIPNVSSGSLLIKTSKTLISTGTERMLVEFSKAGWIKKAKQHPEKIIMVLDHNRFSSKIMIMDKEKVKGNNVLQDLINLIII